MRVVIIILMLLFAISEVEAGRKYNYRPDGREIVCHNGVNKYTRALYGTHGPFRLETSDRPLFATFKKGECRKLVQGGGVSLNKEKLADAMRPVTDADLIAGKYLLVQRGKKNYYLVIAE